MIKRIFTAMAFLGLASTAYAQDPEVTQFYAAPNYLNPAFAGSNAHSRASLLYRNQWPTLGANYITYLASYDHFFPHINSGIGVIVKSDHVGDHISGIQANDVSLQYAHFFQLNRGSYLQLGAQAGYVIKDFGYNEWIYPVQLDDNGIIPGAGNGESFPTQKFGYADVGAGALYFTSKMWIGVAAHHINRPVNAYYQAGNIDDLILPMKLSFHAGYQFPLVHAGPGRVDKTITPVFHYQLQGKSDQMSTGFYINWDPFLFGFWYKGLPFKAYKDSRNTFVNRESVSLMTGMRFDKLSIAYSYDFSVTQLGSFVKTGGAHEVTLLYDFKFDRKRKTVCPHPWKSVRIRIRHHR